MMLDFLRFAFSRYCYFLSHVSAFMAGLAIVLPISYIVVLLSASVLLGSLSAYYRKYPVNIEK